MIIIIFATFLLLLYIFHYIFAFKTHHTIQAKQPNWPTTVQFFFLPLWRAIYPEMVKIVEKSGHFRWPPDYSVISVFMDGLWPHRHTWCRFFFPIKIPLEASMLIINWVLFCRWLTTAQRFYDSTSTHRCKHNIAFWLRRKSIFGWFTRHASHRQRKSVFLVN